MVYYTGVWLCNDAGDCSMVERSDDNCYVAVEVGVVKDTMPYYNSVKLIVALPNVLAASPTFMNIFQQEFVEATAYLHRYAVEKLESSSHADHTASSNIS
jgi:hypothetical protein